MERKAFRTKGTRLSSIQHAYSTSLKRKASLMHAPLGGSLSPQDEYLRNKRRRLMREPSPARKNAARSTYALGKPSNTLSWNVRIPLDTLRHLADFLAPYSSPPLESKDLLDVMKQTDSKFIHRPLPRQWVRQTATAESFTSHRSWLQRLPLELLDMIKPYIEPVDLICLGLTCKELLAKVDYQFTDLANLDYTQALGRTLTKHSLQHVLHQQRFAMTERLDRDTTKQVHLGNHDAVQLACSICRKLHPRNFFSPEEQETCYSERKCLASTALTRICDHVYMNFINLRRIREGLLCRAELKRVYLCPHTCQRNQDRLHGIAGLDIRTHLRIRSDHALLVQQTRQGITRAAVASCLHHFSSIRLCAHWRLGDLDVDQVLEAIRCESDQLGVLRRHCEESSVEWSLSVRDENFQPGLPAALMLTIIRSYRGNLEDCWSDAYLKTVESGMRMKTAALTGLNALEDPTIATNQSALLPPEERDDEDKELLRFWLPFACLVGLYVCFRCFARKSV